MEFEIKNVPIDLKKYYTNTGKTCYKYKKTSVMTVEVLNILNNYAFNEYAEACISGINPSILRVVPIDFDRGSEDIVINRVTVFVDNINKIEKIEQEIPVTIPYYVSSGRCMKKIIIDNIDPKKIKISERIRNIALKYDIKVTRDVTLRPNNGRCLWTEICLGVFDNEKIEMAAFFHELGHILSGKILPRSTSTSKLSQEALAWEVGNALATEEGFNWDYYGDEMKYARSCLKTYMNDDNI